MLVISFPKPTGMLRQAFKELDTLAYGKRRLPVLVVADRIIVLHQGKLVADGDPATVIASPIVQEAYLGVAA